MRVRFLKACPNPDEPKGAVIDLDCGIAAQLQAKGFVAFFPRTDVEIATAAHQYQSGDEHRKPADIAKRNAELEQLMRRNNEC